jgi:hypothetical protein
LGKSRFFVEFARLLPLCAGRNEWFNYSLVAGCDHPGSTPFLDPAAFPGIYPTFSEQFMLNECLGLYATVEIRAIGSLGTVRLVRMWGCRFMQTASLYRARRR